MPVIVLTADVQMAQRQVYLGHGFDECLLKPVSLGHFRRLLTRWGLLANQEAPQPLVTKIDLVDSAPQSPQDDGLKPAIDVSAIADQMGAFDESAREMLGFFIEMTEPVLARLKAGQAAKDTHEIKEAAHSLKGAARSACAPLLGDLAAETQDRAEKNADTEQLVKDIAIEFERVRIAIEALQKS
jgi:HPt (histidine-containing phosphotransfer) domain-containing protein